MHEYTNFKSESTKTKLGIYPPPGWPLSVVLLIMAIITMIIILISGYVKILKLHKRQHKYRKQPHALTTDLQLLRKNGANIKSQVFDTDSSTIIVDNLANYILWNNISGFDASTYEALGNKLNAGITFALGQAVPVGLGTLETD